MSYAAMAAIPLSLWVASRPLAGAAVLATVVGLILGVRHAARLVRCVRDCQEFAFDLGSTVRITVTQTPADDPC